MSLRKTVAYAFGVVVLVTVGTAIYNGSLAHTPYVVGLWTVLALLGVGAYWMARTIKQRITADRSS